MEAAFLHPCHLNHIRQTFTFKIPAVNNSDSVFGIPNSLDPENPRDSRDSGNSRENFPELDHFDIFYDFQHFRSNF